MKIIFEESHNETWTIEHSRALSRNLSNPSYFSYAHIPELVKKHIGLPCSRNSNAPINGQKLEGAKAMVIAHPADPRVHPGCGGSPIFSKQEIACITRFVEQGGGLLLINEYQTDKWRSNINDISDPFGLSFRNDLVTENFDTPAGQIQLQQFVTSNLAQHPINSSVASISYYAGCSIVDRLGDAVVIGSSTDGTPLAVAKEFGRGRVFLVGDSDIFAVPYILQFSNLTFLLNILQWLIKAPQILPAVPENVRLKLERNPRVFLSYAREDSETVGSLYDLLKAAGCDPWLDTKSISGGEDFHVAVEQAIRDADFFVPCISNLSTNKRGMLQRELRLALRAAEKMLDSDIFIIPVLLDDAEPPASLSRFQWIDLRDETFISRLTSAIQEGLSRRAA